MQYNQNDYNHNPRPKKKRKRPKLITNPLVSRDYDAEYERYLELQSYYQDDNAFYA